MFLLVSITNLFITQAFIKHTPEHFVSQLTRGHTGILCEPSSSFLSERAVEYGAGRRSVGCKPWCGRVGEGRRIGVDRLSNNCPDVLLFFCILLAQTPS